MYDVRAGVYTPPNKKEIQENVLNEYTDWKVPKPEQISTNLFLSN